MLAVIQCGLGQFEVRPYRSYDGNDIDLSIIQDFLRVSNDLHLRESFSRAFLRLFTFVGNSDNLRRTGQIEIAGDVWSPVSVSDHANLNHEFTYEVPFPKNGSVLYRFLLGGYCLRTLKASQTRMQVRTCLKT